MKNQHETELRRALADEQIIALYWKRDEKAIDETDFKYRRYLYTVAYQILHDAQDSDECLNDTYLGAWNAIPPAKPSPFQVFLSKIMRNTALVRYKKASAQKRVPSEMTVTLDELDKYLPYNEQALSAEEEYHLYQLSSSLSQCLRAMPQNRCFIFICRYYCCDRISDIAEMLHTSERTVYRELEKARQELKEHLTKEGFFNA